MIIGFNDLPVAKIDDLHLLLDEKTIEKKSTLDILRRGKKQAVTVIPGELYN